MPEPRGHLRPAMKLYRELAGWWPLVSPPGEYAEEARGIARLVREHARIPVHEMLELGSGGGNNASHLKGEFSLTLVEPSSGMRRVSRRLNPECSHRPGDMRSVRLNRRFDSVLVHDAIMYMRTRSDLRAALETVVWHLRPGGVAVLAPDATRETFEPGVHLGGADEAPRRPDGSFRSLRYLEWTLPPGPRTGEEYVVEFALLLRDRNGRVRLVNDVHREGLFSRRTWLDLISEVGLSGKLVARSDGSSSYDAFVATQPPGDGGSSRSRTRRKRRGDPVIPLLGLKSRGRRTARRPAE